MEMEGQGPLLTAPAGGQQALEYRKSEELKVPAIAPGCNSVIAPPDSPPPDGGCPGKKAGAVPTKIVTAKTSAKKVFMFHDPFHPESKIAPGFARVPAKIGDSHVITTGCYV